MATAYDTLLAKAEQLANQRPDYKPIVEDLKTNGFSKTLDEFYRLDVKDSPYVICLKYLIFFINYLGQAPKGTGYISLAEHYIYALSVIPQDCASEVSSSFSTFYLGGLSKELEVENIEEFKEWIRLYKKLKDANAEVQTFENNLSIKLSNRLWAVIGEPEKDILKCIECVGIAIEAQKSLLNIENTVSILVSSIHGYLSMKYEIYNGGQRNDLRDISKLVGALKQLALVGDNEKNQLKQLEDYFGYEDPFRKVKADKPEKEFTRANDLPYNPIDFYKLTFSKTVYASSSNPNFVINIHHYIHSELGDTALKVYDIKNPNYDLMKIRNEVDILETLSSKSTPTNCFLKFIGSYWEASKVYLLMEYHEDTLMTVITKMKNNNQSFTEQHMAFYAHSLISAFSEMEAMGIYHQDIKPHNILVTKDWALKIIDFSVSQSKSYDETTLAATGMHFIQGTQGYMAPELQAHAGADVKVQIKYRRNKADVFSLGLVLLQMYTLEELHTYNRRENHSELMKKVETQVKYMWLKTLLSNMLQLDYNNRPSFKKAIALVPGRATTQ